MPKYKIADIVFSAQLLYDFTRKMCKSYEYDGARSIEFEVIMTEKDIEQEMAITGGNSKPYSESLALYRKLCDYALKNADGIVFHSSAVMVDGNAYLFTAPSGTGKSTHAKLWREMLGDRAVMINDDKPMVRYVDGAFYAYGTPWSGKHRIDNDCKAKIKAICLIRQAKENSIRKASTNEALVAILNQTIRPSEQADMDKLLFILGEMLKSVDLYVLQCNVSKEAAELSYKIMSGDKNEN